MKLESDTMKIIKEKRRREDCGPDHVGVTDLPLPGTHDLPRPHGERRQCPKQSAYVYRKTPMRPQSTHPPHQSRAGCAPDGTSCGVAVRGGRPPSSDAESANGVSTCEADTQ